jgi:hypothetical protein
VTGFDVVRVACWLLAGLVSLYFSVGNARIWTSISLGFFLVFVSEAYRVAPWAHVGTLMALHAAVGIVAVLTITFGFMEYYVFSRTLEAKGEKWVVFASVGLVLVAAGAFIFLNVPPRPANVRNIRMVENAIWVATSLIDIDLLRRIHREVKGSPIAPGFVVFIAAFVLVFLWRGSMLYLQVYGFDADAIALGLSSPDLDPQHFPARVAVSTATHRFASVLSSLTVGGAFLYLARALR